MNIHIILIHSIKKNVTPHPCLAWAGWACISYEVQNWPFLTSLEVSRTSAKCIHSHMWVMTSNHTHNCKQYHAQVHVVIISCCLWDCQFNGSCSVNLFWENTPNPLENSQTSGKSLVALPPPTPPHHHHPWENIWMNLAIHNNIVTVGVYSTCLYM